MKTEWISVEEKLPDNTDEVVVCHWYYDDNLDLAIAWYHQGNKTWHADEGLLEASNYDGGCTIELSDVPTHWMPLPEPPK